MCDEPHPDATAVVVVPSLSFSHTRCRIPHALTRSHALSLSVTGQVCGGQGRHFLQLTQLAASRQALGGILTQPARQVVNEQQRFLRCMHCSHVVTTAQAFTVHQWPTNAAPSSYFPPTQPDLFLTERAQWRKQSSSRETACLSTTQLWP